MECHISELKSPKNTQQLILSPFVNDKVENVIYLSKMTLHGEYIRRAVARWLTGLVVGRRTCDLVAAGSRPGRDAAA